MNKCMCGGTLNIDGGDFIRDGVYRWYASYRCNTCDKSTEIDGRDIDNIPNDIKALIIKREGIWGLRSTVSKTKIKYLMDKILQQKCNDSFEEIFFVGTHNQVKWIKSKLITKGIDDDNLVLQKL